MVERPDALPRMLEPQPWRSDHLRRLAELRDDRIVRAVNGEKAKATDCTDQAKRNDRGQGAPIRPPVGCHCIITRSNHGPSVAGPLQRWAVRLGAMAPRRAPRHDQNLGSVHQCRIEGKRRRSAFCACGAGAKYRHWCARRGPNDPARDISREPGPRRRRTRTEFAQGAAPRA